MDGENMITKRTFGGRGKILHSQAREIVANIRAFMKDEADNKRLEIPLGNYKERVLKATGISTKLYRTICAESKVTYPVGKKKFCTPKKHKKVSRKTVIPQEAERMIRDIVCSFYITEKQRPTLRGILKKVREAGVGFEGGKSTLWMLLQKMGFKFRKCSDGRKALVESHDIRLKRIEFLRAMRKFRADNRPIIYSDATYIHRSHTQSSDGTDSTSKGLQKLTEKEKRLIIVHAGGEMGFVPNGLLIFTSGTKSGNYHDEMNLVNHENWLVTQILPNIPPQSVFVVDNASYHNVKIEKEPTSATRKAEMISWLQKQGVPHDATKTQPELYKIVKLHKNRNPLYRMDEMFKQHGHTVLRLPPHSPELNPIEKVWTEVKNYVASHNVTFELPDVQKLAENKFHEITEEQWTSLCNDVKEIENQYYENEIMLDEAFERLTFTVNTGSSSESDSESDSDLSYSSDVEVLSD